MDRKALVLLFIAASTLTTCMGQMEMGAMMEGMAGMGGLAGMMGGMGGMGGLASMMGGMGGMGGLASMMGGMGGGMGGMGGMIRGMITPMIANAVATSKMNEVVKIVLGPQANPNAQILDYAKAQQRVPATIAEMVPYIKMMVELSKSTGIVMPDGSVKKPAPTNLLGYTSTTGTGTKTTTGSPSIEEVKNLVIERGLMWFNSQPPAAQNTNTMTPQAGGGFVF